ncbi:Uma2 family endonuclease [Limnofasciculus baicalensis]|uniref:Uma2 family endonuclease n=1 Tax=Limnofasciculus baicalensis BBK-W-15 TaxID=2699891 RepID=A0AAE3GTF6_9CYAN|nr:Uma2 family endonuclease [Limnofasciculus baicalensis]MCP2729453.1 Uma2 family endonuclease [Limnofasciculus baicalensis BBK-W-15]
MTLAIDSLAQAQLDTQTAPEDIIIPSGDLWSDEPELESDLHRDQIELLLNCLKWWWHNRTDFYASGNLSIYFSPEQITTRDFRGPDFFVVLGVENRPRKSWVLWNEQGKYPNVIIELLSHSTANVDRGLKKELYQDTFRTPEYFWFHPNTQEFKGFRLMGGKYQPIVANESGWLWSNQLELFIGVHQSKLRFFSLDGELIPTAEERAISAQQQAESERQQKELLQQQAESERQQKEVAQEQLAKALAKLKELGIEPD